MKWIHSDPHKRLYGAARSQAAKRRLLLFPHSGAGPSYYLKWLEFLPPDFELWIVNYPGREGRFLEPFAKSINNLSYDIAQSLIELKPLPLLIFGHSLGAAVGFEVAQFYETNGGMDLTKLIVSSRPPKKTNDELTNMLKLSDRELINAVCNKYGGIASEIIENDEFQQFFTPILRSDLNLLSNYSTPSSPKLNTDIHASFGDEEVSFSSKDIDEWRNYTNKDFTITIFPGDHFYFQDNLKNILSTII